MASIFTKIINGEIPCYKVAEDDDFIAFLDINPVRRGHTLVVPKEERDYIFRNSDEVLSKIMLFARTVAQGIEAAITCKRIGLVVVGLEVPHTHIHLIPIDKEADLNIGNPKLSLPPDELQKIANDIKLAISKNAATLK